MEIHFSSGHPQPLASFERAGTASDGGVQVHSAYSSTASTHSTHAKTSAERQLQASKSNYEILASGAPLLSAYTLAPSLRASIGKKRVQHQREEKMRRDRMKHALELPAAVLPPEMSSFASGPKRQPRNSNRVETVEQALEYINMLHARLDDDVKRRECCGCVTD